MVQRRMPKNDFIREKIVLFGEFLDIRNEHLCELDKLLPHKRDIALQAKNNCFNQLLIPEDGGALLSALVLELLVERCACINLVSLEVALVEDEVN